MAFFIGALAFGVKLCYNDIGKPDIYSAAWDEPERDSLYTHPNISKLMDSKIIYCADEKYLERLSGLRRRTSEILNAPFSSEDYRKAENMLNKQYFHYGNRRAYEKINAVKNIPEKLITESILTANSAEQVKKRLAALMRAAAALFGKVRKTLPVPENRDALMGTYEEMFSNLRKISMRY